MDATAAMISSSYDKGLHPGLFHLATQRSKYWIIALCIMYAVVQADVPDEALLLNQVKRSGKKQFSCAAILS